MYWLVVKNGYVIASESVEPRLGSYGQDCEIFQWPTEEFGSPDNPKPDPRIVSPETAWGVVRDTRNQLLLESDWTQLNNAPLTASEVLMWANYRQALRDITDAYTNPSNIIWPTKPARQ